MQISDRMLWEMKSCKLKISGWTKITVHQSTWIKGVFPIFPSKQSEVGWSWERLLQLILILPRARENIIYKYGNISYKYKVHRCSIERDGDLKVSGTYAYKQLGSGRPILCGPRYVPTKRSCQISCLSGQKTVTETSLKSLGIRQCRYSCQRCLSPALQRVSWPDPDACFNSVQVAIHD